MGTNYYLITDCCEHCGRGEEALHIGKSSAGWCFALHVRHPEEKWPDRLPTSLEEWKTLWSQPRARIEDEYGTTITPEGMENCITCRSWEAGREWTPETYRENQAEPGPNGLVRCRIDGRCVGHGESTYDLVTGEFS